MSTDEMRNSIGFLQAFVPEEKRMVPVTSPFDLLRKWQHASHERRHWLVSNVFDSEGYETWNVRLSKGMHKNNTPICDLFRSTLADAVRDAIAAALDD